MPRQGLFTRQAIDAIRAAGGIPVLAHYPAAPEQADLIDLLVGWGVGGLEVYYRRFEPETVDEAWPALADGAWTRCHGRQ